MPPARILASSLLSTLLALLSLAAAQSYRLPGATLASDGEALTLRYGSVEASYVRGIGWLNGWAGARHALGPETRAFLLVGLLGGFTTYSAFAWETVELGHEGLSFPAVANVVLHVTLGLAAAWAGVALHRTA